LLTVSQWADRFRRLSPEASAEPGDWRTDRAPYQREIMDCLSPSSPIERVVVMSGAQVGKTELLNNAAGFVIDQDPGPILVVQPTTAMGEAWSKDRLAPMLRDSPALAAKVAGPRSRDAENTLAHKRFAGGHITIVGANAPSGLASRPIRFVLLDEVDRYPRSAGSEGDPVSLAIKRSATFWNRKILIVSTPTIQGGSRIDAEWLRSDRRRFWVPCALCGVTQVLSWRQVKFKEVGLPPEEAVYQCPHCGGLIPSWRKQAMLAGGEWRPEAAGDGRTAGFHLSELYSPWRSWGETATDFVAAKGSPTTLRTWVNTALGEPWEEKGEAPDWARLMAAREDYPLGRIPAGALVLTGMADVQKDRLEWAAYGWGTGLEGWLVDLGVIRGDPAGEAPWRELAAIIERSYDGDGSTFPIDAFGVDSGYLSHRVYAFARGRPRVFATDGRAGALLPLIGRPSAVDVTWGGKTIPKGVHLWPLGTFGLKMDIYARLRAVIDGEPRLHFPLACEREFFEQLTAEYLAEVERRSGQTDREWRLLRNRPNEQLDLIVGARAMAAKLGLDRWSTERWEELRAQRRGPAEAAPSGAAIAAPKLAAMRAARRSTWMSQ
jgi:phage terminase large subunit GpA-like protein